MNPSRFKDNPPHLTIKKIQAILKRHPIKHLQTKWFTLRKKVYSCQIKVRGTDFAVTGKGLTKASAQASGYGELMERIQNLQYFYIARPPRSDFLESISIKIKHILKNKNLIAVSKMSRSLLAYLEGNKNITYRGVPFYHYNSRTLIKLPHQEIYKAIMTNGWCAGNSPEEAIINGLCECFERRVLSQIFLKKNLRFPTIRVNIENFAVFPLIKLLRSKGYTVSIKDCSLGGKFPVAGVLVLNKQASKYQFKLGSAPTFEIAVERAILEMFEQENNLRSFEQNNMLLVSHALTKDDFNNKILKRLNFWRALLGRGTKGHYPLWIISRGSKKISIEKVFLDAAQSNKEILKWLLAKFINNKYDFFIRDNSYLGFPSYNIYIPGLSDLYGYETTVKFKTEIIQEVYKNIFYPKDVSRRYRKLLKPNKISHKKNCLDRVTNKMLGMSTNQYTLDKVFYSFENR